MPLAVRLRTLTGALAAGLLLAVLAFLPGHAGAQDAAKPAPCTGQLLFTDPTGDAAVDPTGLGLPPLDEGLPSQDITGAFLNYANGVLTANIEVANLSKDVPSPLDSQGGAYWYVIYSDGAVRRFVRAVNADGSDIAYAYGTINVDSGVYTTEGETKGTFFEGPKGVIQIEIPAAAGAKDGAVFKGVIAVADDIIGLDDASGLNNNVDTAPDTGSVTDDTKGLEYTVTACPSTPGTGTTTTPGGTPGGGGTGGGTTPASTELPLKVTKVLDGAKKAKKKKAIRITVSATETITNLSLSLKGKSGTGKTYASVKLASLSGTKTLKLKRTATLKAGSYTLVAKGTVGGKARKAKLAVKVKK